MANGQSPRLLAGWMDSRRVYSTQHKVHSHIPLFTHFALLHLLFCHLLGHPARVGWGPAPNKASNQGKVQGPQKCSQIKHRGVENQTKGPNPLESTFGMLGAGEGCPGGCRAPQGFWQEEPWDRHSDRGAGAAPRNKLRGDQSVHRQDPASSPELNSC